MNKGCLISTIVIVALLSAGLFYYFYEQNRKDPIVYDTTKPFVTSIVNKTVATGSIKPRQEVAVKPEVSGVVEELYVEAGDLVKKGQKIGKIKLVPSQVNINTAQSNVELARIRLKESERELRRQTDVNSGQLDVLDAQANFEDAQREEERQRRLFEDGVISEVTYNPFKLQVSLAKTRYENAKIASVNSLRQFEADLDIRKQELDAAINNLQLLREGASRKSKQVMNIVVSTVDGMVLDVPVEEGSSVVERNTFNEGTSIATIADMNNLIFEGKVDESDVGKLQEGMPLSLTVGALPGKSFDANLEHIAPQGIDEEGTVKFEVRAAITPVKDVFLRAGYSANADIILDKKEKVIAINERDLMFEEDSTTYVEVAVGDQEFEKRVVSVGMSDGVQVEVISGLDTLTNIKVVKDPNG